MKSLKLRTKTVLGALSLGLALSLTGCGGGSGYVTTYSNTYYGVWYNVYGKVCSTTTPSYGCDYYSNGHELSYTSDPYYTSYVISYGSYTYYDTYGTPYYYSGYAWQSPDGIIYDSSGYPINEAGTTHSRDKARTGAVKEKEKVAEAAATFHEQHPALSEAASSRIAISLNAWATLTKDHSIKSSRNAADIAEYSQRLFGVSVDKITPALVNASQGNKSALIDLKDQVGANWGDNSPNREETQQILMTWFKTQAANL